MKLARVEIAGFRGFRVETTFQFAPGFTVIDGRNGVGKSTVFDAVEYAKRSARRTRSVGS